MPELAKPILVVTGPGERRLVLGQLESSAYVVDDLQTGRRIAVNGDYAPFVISIDREPYLVVAGLGNAIAHQVDVECFDGVASYLVKNHVWMSFPERFVGETRVTVTWRAADGTELRRIESPLFTPESVAPVFGDHWTWYA